MLVYYNYLNLKFSQSTLIIIKVNKVTLNIFRQVKKK